MVFSVLLDGHPGVAFRGPSFIFKPIERLCLCARWGFGPFTAALAAQPWGLWEDLRSTGHVHLSAPRPHPRRLGASEQRCPCCASPRHFSLAQWTSSSPRPRSRPPRLERPLPSALTSSTGPHSQPPSCSWLPMSPCLPPPLVSGSPQRPTLPPYRTPSHLCPAVAGGPHPVSFLPSFRFWVVGGFFHGRGPCLRGSDRNTGNVCLAAGRARCSHESMGECKGQRQAVVDAVMS